jgi:hypothetical protein
VQNYLFEPYKIHARPKIYLPIINNFEKTARLRYVVWAMRTFGGWGGRRRRAPEGVAILEKSPILIQN